MRTLLVGILVFFLGTLTARAGPEPVRPMVGREREHLVAPGENLYLLAQQYGLAIEHLAFANGLEPLLYVPPGRRLVVPGRRVLPARPPADGIVVNLPERGLFLFRGGSFEKFYPIAIGQPGRFATPTGSYTIATKIENPTWIPPEWAGLGETLVPPGPDNPLGDRWIGLSGNGVGIHATTSPMSIGQAVSHGCMRMYPSMARELFDKVEVGWPVRIDYETVKLGYDEETGALYLVAFPDVYGRAEPLSEARRLLEEAGVSALIDEDDLRRLVEPPRGRPLLALGSPARVTLNGNPLELPLPVVNREGFLLVSVELARALGCEVTWEAATRTVLIRRGEVVLSFPLAREPGQTPGSCAYRWGSRTLVPARLLLQGLGVVYRWENGELVIEDAAPPQ